METRLRLLLIRAGFPDPTVQAELRDSKGSFVARADLYYPTARLVIEYDGGNHRDRLVEDNRRQNLLVNAGYTLLRFTASDIYDRPEVLLAQVRVAIGFTPRRMGDVRRALPGAVKRTRDVRRAESGELVGRAALG